jgi:hypothetical protein
MKDLINGLGDGHLDTMAGGDGMDCAGRIKAFTTWPMACRAASGRLATGLAQDRIDGSVTDRPCRSARGRRGPPNPMNVDARAPSASPKRVISAKPRVMSAVRVFAPNPIPSAMPVAIAMTFFTAPPTSTPTMSSDV